MELGLKNGFFVLKQSDFKPGKRARNIGNLRANQSHVNLQYYVGRLMFCILLKFKLSPHSSSPKMHPQAALPKPRIYDQIQKTAHILLRFAVLDRKSVV